jgi:putative glutamine amidotransferase
MPTIAVAPCARMRDYEEALSRAGGRPRVLDRGTDRPADVVGRADGLVLTGGADVLPSLYGATAHPGFVPAEAGRDEWEIELIRLAAAADRPLLAICRGLQVLAVARGGTLVQDIPAEVGATVDHAVPEPLVAIAHDVWVAGDSLLARLLGERLEDETCPVNSRHHQAPRDPGRGLRISATAPDGVIEALEDPEQRFCIGVGWHPENFYRTGEFRMLFEGFVEACGA